MLRSIAASLRLMFRILTFTATPEELDALGWPSLAMGIPIVWLVGYGRWWDESLDISFTHRIGLGSVAYVLILAGLLWAVGLPVTRRTWSYGKVLAFVAFTGPPAALYAIPVESWTDPTTAVRLNIGFLTAVSAYRLALLLWFYRRGAGLSFFDAVICGLLPVGFIGAMIAYLGLSEQILDIMGGLRGQSPTVEAYEFVTGLSCSALFGAPVLLVLFGFAIARRFREKASGTER